MALPFLPAFTTSVVSRTPFIYRSTVRSESLLREATATTCSPLRCRIFPTAVPTLPPPMIAKRSTLLAMPFLLVVPEGHARPLAVSPREVAARLSPPRQSHAWPQLEQGYHDEVPLQHARMRDYQVFLL